jgi:hypothetical protein
MTTTRPLADPADYRRRAQSCREKAESATFAEGDLLEAAKTWDELAEHAEMLRDAFTELRRKPR